MPEQRAIKYFDNFAEIKDGTDGIITALASNDAIDRDGEIICHKAFEESLPGFVKNGVILSCHQHRLADGSPPMIGIPLSADYNDRGLEVKFRLGKGELAQKWRAAKEDGTWRGVSVGFIPLKGEVRQIDEENVPNVVSFFTGDNKTAYHHTKAELLELSAVPVGSNRDATLRDYQDNEILDSIEQLLTDGFSQSRKELLEELKAYIETLIVPENETLKRIMDSSSNGDTDDSEEDRDLKLILNYLRERKF